MATTFCVSTGGGSGLLLSLRGLDGSCVGEGKVGRPIDRFVWDSSETIDHVRFGSASGMLSFSAPISSARSVVARLEVPMNNWRPRTR